MPMPSRLAAALFFVFGTSAMAAEPAAPLRFEVATMVEDGAIGEDGSVWFKSLFDNVRFVLPAGKNPRADDLWRIILAANQSKRELKVWFDAAAGEIEEESAALVFPICAAALADERVEIATSCGAPVSSFNPKQELMVGWALHQKSSHVESRKLLDRAVASSGESRAFRLIAVRAHANLLESIGYETEPRSEESDRAHVAALADYRTLAEMQPDVAEHVLQIGYQQEALGDYRNAEETYRQLMTKWPEEDYRANIRLAAIERRRGNHDRALELTNRVAEKYPDQLGMKFYYHRGWTLTKMRRYDEAIADFTAGLREQPDYPWAHARRACAQALIGQHKLALADMEMALEMLGSSSIGDRKDLVHDKARARAVIAMLRAAIAAGSSQPIPDVCEGYWPSFEQHRTPSPLLPR